MNNIPDDILRQIGETYGAESWEPITGIRWTGDTPWQLWMFDQYIEIDGDPHHHALIIRREVYDPEDVSVMLSSDDVFTALD